MLATCLLIFTSTSYKNQLLSFSTSLSALSIVLNYSYSFWCADSQFRVCETERGIRKQGISCYGPKNEATNQSMIY